LRGNLKLLGELDGRRKLYYALHKKKIDRRRKV